jgi:hypothetical protein
MPTYECTGADCRSRLWDGCGCRQAAETLLCLNSFDQPQERQQPPAPATSAADAAVLGAAAGALGGSRGGKAAAGADAAAAGLVSPLQELVQGIVQQQQQRPGGHVRPHPFAMHRKTGKLGKPAFQWDATARPSALTASRTALLWALRQVHAL